LIEGNPESSHPLSGSVGALTMVAINLYALALGLSVLEVQCPDPGAVRLYQNLGFSYDREGRLVRKITA
jgi:hypothetical protein